MSNEIMNKTKKFNIKEVVLKLSDIEKERLNLPVEEFIETSNWKLSNVFTKKERNTILNSYTVLLNSINYEFPYINEDLIGYNLYHDYDIEYLYNIKWIKLICEK